MKMKWTILAGLLMGAVSVQADLVKGSQMISVGLAGASFNDDLDLNGGHNSISDGGGAFAQYLYVVRSSPTLAFGIEAMGLTLTDDSNQGLIPGMKSDAESELGVYQAMIKLTYPSGRFRPYVIGGLGGSRSVLQSHIPNGPTLFDSSRWGVCGSMGAGIDVFFGERFFIGSEIRQTFISQLEHTPTPAGEALGDQPVRDPGGFSNLLIKIGYKFGAK